MKKDLLNSRQLYALEMELEILFKVASMNEDNAKLSGEDPRFAKVYASSVKTSIENIREILNKKSTLYPVG